MTAGELVRSPSAAGSPRFTVSRAMSDDEKIACDSPYVALFREIVVYARSVGASDIHLQPTIQGLDVRLRVLGELETYKRLEVQHRQSFINEVKRVANFSLAMLGVPQDSSIHFEMWSLKLRASLLPSQYGEKIVLRLLDLSKKFELGAQGFSENERLALLDALNCENGLVLLSGPTGSGKTTTLYALLSALDRKRKNVMTLEDPVEYEIEGLTQTQVSETLTFSQALRATLRQDPDVVLVGEIRDEETAKLCMAAASTGHLVLSTIHANSSEEIYKRMRGLGVDDLDLRSLLRLSVAQRLLPKICGQCSTEAPKEVYPASAGQGDFRLRNLDGCESCRAGISGQVPILEYRRGEGTGEGGGATWTLIQSCRDRAERGIVDVRETNAF